MSAEPSMMSTAAIASDTSTLITSEVTNGADACATSCDDTAVKAAVSSQDVIAPTTAADDAATAAVTLATAEASLDAFVAAERTSKLASREAAAVLRRAAWATPAGSDEHADAEALADEAEAALFRRDPDWLAELALRREAVALARIRCDAFAPSPAPVVPVSSATAGWNREPSTRPLAVTADALPRAPARAATVPKVPPPPMAHVPTSDLDSAKLTPPNFVVEQLIPRNQLCFLGAHGGTGKSSLTLELAAHVATGASWAGFECERGRAIFFSLEDSGELIRYRLQAIVAAYGLDRALIARNLIIFDGSEALDTAIGYDVLADGNMRFALSELGVQLETIAKPGCDLIVIDGATDAFGGSEVDRQQVRRFLRKLMLIGRAAGAGVLLTGHIDKAAARFGAAGNSYSGSSQWNNGPRSRLSLVEENGTLELRQEKSNLGKKAEPVRLHFNDVGVLMPAMFSAVAEHGVDAQLLHAIGEATIRGDIIGTGRTGPATALACAKHLPGFPAALRSPAAFWAAIGRLEKAGQLLRETYQTDGRKTRHKFAPAPVAPICAD